MKKIVIFFVVVIVLVVSFCVAIMFFINFKGKDLIVNAIKDNFGVQAQIGSVSVKFPFNVEVRDFKCEDVSFKRAEVFLGGFNPFTSQVSLNSLVLEGVEVKVTRIKEGIVIKPFLDTSRQVFAATEPKVVSKNQPEQTNSADVQVVPKEGVKEKGECRTCNFGVKINKFSLKDAKVNFIDTSLSQTFNCVVGDISLKLSRFIYPQLPKFFIKLNASLQVGDTRMQDILSLEGWVDYANKNMDTDLLIKGVDFHSFAPYYPPFWQPNNLGIQKASLSLLSNLKSRNDNLVIDNLINLDEIEFVKYELPPVLQEGEESSLPVTEDLSKLEYLKTIIAFFKGDKDKPSVHFQLITKMSSPSFDFSSLQKEIKMGIKFDPQMIIEQIFGKTKQILKDSLKGTKEMTVDKAADTLKNTFENVGDSFKDLFKKK